MTIQPCNSYGYPTTEKYEIYDMHSDHVKIFHDIIKKKFNITI